MLATGFGRTPPAAARQQRAGRPAVWVVGDSVTVFSEEPLRARLRSQSDGGVEIDAVSGRSVVLLDDLVRQRLARGRRPRAMVLALGTNPDPSWTRSDFRRVLDLVPESIGVVLVTVHRAPGTAPAWVVRAMADYSRWMRELAGPRDNVCLASWRARVVHRSGRYTLDGVHPNARGAQLFSQVVANAVDRCAVV